VCEILSQLEAFITEQRTGIKFCVLLQISAAETLTMLRQPYGERTMKKSQVCHWHKPFPDGCEIVDDDFCSGHPSSTNEANIKFV
jgi:hypothetical protein